MYSVKQFHRVDEREPDLKWKEIQSVAYERHCNCCHNSRNDHFNKRNINKTQRILDWMHPVSIWLKKQTNTLWSFWRIAGQIFPAVLLKKIRVAPFSKMDAGHRREMYRSIWLQPMDIYRYKTVMLDLEHVAHHNLYSSVVVV